MKKLLAVLTTLICLGSQATFAATIVTSAGDDSRLKQILGFDAGALGIVDIDFAGITFNNAFGSDATPPGYLFADNGTDARSILDDIMDLLNAHNANASTAITTVEDSVAGGSNFNFWVAYDPNIVAVGQTRAVYSTTWAWNGSSTSQSRLTTPSTFARLTAPSAVPIPAAAWLFGSAILGLAGVARHRKA